MKFETYFAIFLICCTGGMNSEIELENKDLTERSTSSHPKNPDESSNIVTNHCIICMEDVKKATEKLTLNSCRHIFHSKCMKTWLEKNDHCPICRTKICDINVNVSATLANLRKMKIRTIQENEEYVLQLVDIQSDSNVLNNPAQSLNSQFLHQIWKPAILWLIVQGGILSASFLIPNWYRYCFPWVQSMNAVSLSVALISRFTSDHKPFIKIAILITALSGVCTYNSSMVFLFSAPYLIFSALIPSLILFWGGLALVVQIGMSLQRSRLSIDDEIHEIQRYTQRKFLNDLPWYSWWLILEVGIAMAKISVEKWALLFAYMQVLQVLSLSLQISSRLGPSALECNYTVAILISFATLFFSYHSITGFVLTTPALIPATLIPWGFFFLCGVVLSMRRSYLDDANQFQISRWASFIWTTLWAIVEVGIILSKIYIPMWSVYFLPMQAGHTVAFLLALTARFVKNKAKWILFYIANFLITLLGLISYYSVMGFLFTEHFTIVSVTVLPTILVLFSLTTLRIVRCFLP